MNIIEKPWGHEEILETNERYTVKRLFMKAGHKCSIQYHECKHESVYVLSGKLTLYIGKDLEKKIMLPNDFYVVPPGLIHRMEAVEDSVYLEASTSELNDVVRISDEYGRV